MKKAISHTQKKKRGKKYVSAWEGMSPPYVVKRKDNHRLKMTENKGEEKKSKNRAIPILIQPP